MRDIIGDPSTYKTTITGTLPSVNRDRNNNDGGKNLSSRHRNCFRINDGDSDNFFTAIYYASSSMKGRRKTQEDAVIIETKYLYPRDRDKSEKTSSHNNSFCNQHAIFGIFDGHGTSFASNYAAENFLSIFRDQPSFLEYCRQSANQNCNEHGDSVIQRTNHRGRKERSQSNNAQWEPPRLAPVKLSHLLENAIRQTFIQLDTQMLRELMAGTQVEEEKQQNDHKNSPISNDAVSTYFDKSESGTTAIIIILTPQEIICANLGDSRAILCRAPTSKSLHFNGNDKAIIPLSKDHKPSNRTEKNRIEAAGGVILGGKIEGRLAVSRALGDFDFKDINSVLCAVDSRIGGDGDGDGDEMKKIGVNIICADKRKDANKFVHPEDQMVCCIPEITTIQREMTQDKYIVLACDGIWDVLSNEQCEQLISTVFKEGERDLGLVCEELLDQCFAKGSLDNLTATILMFPANEIGVGGGVWKRRKQRVHKKR